MSFDRELKKRSGEVCELSKHTEHLQAYKVPFSTKDNADTQVWICQNCINGLENPKEADENLWRCLQDTIWSEVPAIKVLSWRMLHKLKQFDWTQDLIDIAYLDDEELEWAKASVDHIVIADEDKHRDCFGAVLEHGDNVVLVKTLEVKGATFDAKVGTVVHNIRLVPDNNEQIEGRVNGSMIVILTKYVRKNAK